MYFAKLFSFNSLGSTIICEALCKVSSPYHYIGNLLENVLRRESSGRQGFLALNPVEAVATEGGKLFYQTRRGEKRTPEV